MSIISSTDKIYLASGSKLKLEALQTALTRLGIGAMPIPSPEMSAALNQTQPIGFSEIKTTMLNRFTTLEKQVTVYDFLVAIESGLVKIEDCWYDIAMCGVKSASGTLETGISNSIRIPDEIASEVLNGKELGPLLQERYGITEKDPAIYYTNSQVKRSEILSLCLVTILSRF